MTLLVKNCSVSSLIQTFLILGCSRHFIVYIFHFVVYYRVNIVNILCAFSTF